MKVGIRIAVCALLLAAAGSTASLALAPFGAAREAEGDAMFVLGEAEGRVAVYSPEDPRHPLEVTAIELASLREGDRALLAGGLPVDSPEALAQLLEDLGS